MFIKNHQSGEIATILAVSALVILGITTVASSFVFNKNQTTTNTRASGFQGVCSAFSDADMPKPDGFKWQAHCGDEFKCTDPNHSDCQSKFPGKAVWCYGFDGPNKSNADWRCLSLESTAPQAQPTSPMEQSKPINNPAANPQQPAQPNQPAAQQPLPQPANCLSTEGLPNGAQPNCTPGKTVAKDNYYWKIISCKDTNCQPSAGNEWCYGFADGIGKMQLASPQPIPDACKQSIRLMEAAQSASQPQPNNSGSQPAAQPQAPLEETSRTNPQQPTQPTQANPQTSANSGTTKTDCQNKGFVCLSTDTKNAEYPDYEAKQYSCNNTAGINCYGPKAQASAKPLCEQKGGFCSNVCEGDYINSSDPPMNSSCQQSGRNQCCVKKAATPATSCESQGFYSDEPSCKNSKEFKENTGTCQFSAPNGCYKFVKSTQQQVPPVGDNTNCKVSMCESPNATISYATKCLNTLSTGACERGKLQYFRNQVDCESNPPIQINVGSGGINYWCDNQARNITFRLHIQTAAGEIDHSYHKNTPFKIRRWIERSGTWDYYNFGDDTFTLDQLKASNYNITRSYTWPLSYADIKTENQDSFAFTYKEANMGGWNRLHTVDFGSAEVDWKTNTVDLYLKIDTPSR